MLAEITLQRSPKVSARRQDLILRRASELYWREIPHRIPNGALVQRIIAGIVAIARSENSKPTFPYAPGVTGTALRMDERAMLLEARLRKRIPGADDLVTALGSAIAHNVISAELDRPVKGRRYMVLYLNRILCPRFGLPLGRGGFRERSLETMTRWTINELDVPAMPDVRLEPLPL